MPAGGHIKFRIGDIYIFGFFGDRGSVFRLTGSQTWPTFHYYFLEKNIFFVLCKNILGFPEDFTYRLRRTTNSNFSLFYSLVVRKYK